MPFRTPPAGFAVLIVSTLLSVPASAQTTKPAGDFQPLFNGKDLSGFYTYLKGDGKNNDPQKVFQVDDGTVHIYKDAADGSEMPFGYVATEKEYTDYDLRLQYKWGEKRFGKRSKARRDAGVLYHVTGPDGARKDVWPYSIECQIQENDVGDIYSVGTSVTTTIDPAKEKTPTFMEATAGGVELTTPQKIPVNTRVIRSEMAEVPGWNTVEIIVHGDSAVHVINGKVNNRILHATVPNLDKPGEWVPLNKGRIVFQAEGAEVFYRNIEIRPLAADKVQ